MPHFGHTYFVPDTLEGFFLYGFLLLHGLAADLPQLGIIELGCSIHKKYGFDFALLVAHFYLLTDLAVVTYFYAPLAGLQFVP